MEFRNFISIVFVLLISIQVVASQFVEGASETPRSFDEWAFQYEPEQNPEHLQNLREIVERARESAISAFEVVAKIRNQQQQGDIIEDLVHQTKEQLYHTVERAGCQVLTNSDYISLQGNVRNILYASVACAESDRYFQLIEDRDFWSNVLHIRSTDRINNGIREVFSISNAQMSGIFEIPPPPPPAGSTVDPVYPCADYTTSPWRNWFADAMHGGKINCEFLTDDCAYNKGRGGHLIMIDSGISSHPELDPLVASGRLTQAQYFSPEEQSLTDLYNDNMGHGTSIAALAVGKFVGIVKQATLQSIKVTIDGDNHKMSINAVVAAVNDIISKQRAKGRNSIGPTVIFGGMAFTWSSKEGCIGTFDTKPNNPTFKRNVMSNQTKRATALSPLPYSVNPPQSNTGSARYGTWTYDCAFTIVEALKNVISYGIPYLVPSANGAEYWDPITGDGPFAAGFDRCFATRWLNAVPMCMQADEYLYSPLFMTSGYRGDSRNPANSGLINRAIVIGGYGKTFENARWYNSYVVDPNSEDNFFDMGGANYGSVWNLINNGERCVDYAAPAADFENLPLNPNIKYGTWDLEGFTNGMSFGNYGIKEAPMSGTSYATPLAAGSILETLIRQWRTIKPTTFWPDYNFGTRVIDAVDYNNVITHPTYGKITVTQDQAIVDMYNFFSFWVAHPAPLPYFTCSAKYGNYYTNDAIAQPVNYVNEPHNRNLFMPKYGSSEIQCLSASPPKEVA